MELQSLQKPIAAAAVALSMERKKMQVPAAGQADSDDSPTNPKNI
jgi:hypothetical protein